MNKEEGQLTSIQRTIVENLAEGMSTKEIAVSLHVPDHIIEEHKKKIMHKYAARNSVNLIAILFRLGKIK